MHLRKSILVMGILTMTGTAWAADKTPTLGEVLKASGIDVNGYIDFSHNNLSTDAGSATYRVFDTERRGFNLQMIDLTVSKLPENGVGGLVEVNYGHDANITASAGTGAADDTDVQQAYMQYASGPFSVMAGKYDTLAGAELIQNPGNTNFSRSFLFGFAIPFTHTGLRAAFAANDAVNLKVGINNGWDVLKESGQTAAANGDLAFGKTLELGVSGSPVEMFSYSVAYYTGKESGGTTSPADRKVLDVVATINATDALSFVLNYDSGEQEKVAAIGGSTAKWDGLAGYVNFMMSEQWRLSFRTEKFDDKDGYRTGVKQKLKESTLTVGYMPASNMELRAEYRKDKSDQNVFTESGTLKKTQNSLGLEALYTF